MYPKNAASPPRIYLGPVIQISDGAVQTSGVSVVVRPEGGSESAGGGTLSFGGSSSAAYYVPTQGETNYSAFAVVAYKSDCIPAGVTVVTVNNSTAGVPPDSAGVTTLLSRITSTLFTGITSLAQWLGLMAGKQTANSTALAEIKATGAGSGTYDETTDSLEAIRNRGDAAWTAGSSPVTVTPIQSTVSAGEVVSTDPLVAYQYSGWDFLFTIVDDNDDPVDLSAASIAMIVYDRQGTKIQQVGPGSGITVSGDDNNQVTVVGDDTGTQTHGEFNFVLRNLVTDRVLALGTFIVQPVADYSGTDE